MPYLIDTHAHLCTKEYDSDREQIIQHAFDARVKKIINVGASVEESRQAVALAQKYENVWAAVGIHPHECGPPNNCHPELPPASPNGSAFGGRGVSGSKTPESSQPSGFRNPPSLELRRAGEFGMTKQQLKEIETLAREPKVVAVGETGFDFAPPPLGETARSRHLQTHIFTGLIGLAVRIEKPLIIHSRGAAPETFELLSECIHTCKEGRGQGLEKIKGVIHCFNYSWDWAENFLKLGFHLSFTGIVTYPNARMAQETVIKTPLERIMIETDCPFLAPQPVRGMRNEPKNVIMIAEKIAELKGISFEEVSETTTRNAEGLFGI